MAWEMFVCAHQRGQAMPARPASWIKCVLETSTYLSVHKPLPLTFQPPPCISAGLASRIYAIRMHANGWHKIIQFYILLNGLVEWVRGGRPKGKTERKVSASFRHSPLATMSMCECGRWTSARTHAAQTLSKFDLWNFIEQTYANQI